VMSPRIDGLCGHLAGGQPNGGDGAVHQSGPPPD
jgi:hypothetical protein